MRTGLLAACLLLAACGSGGSGGGGGSGGASSATFSGQAIVSVGASPTTLTVGESTTLTWSSSGASSCQASGGWNGTVGLSGSLIATPQAAGTVTYTLTCDGVASSATVVVANAATPSPTVSLSLAPTSTGLGQSSTLTWSSTNAASCTASGAWDGNRATSGSVAVSQSVAGTYEYSLTCSGGGGSAVGSATLGVSSVSNVATVTIDSGPAGVAGVVGVINVPFVSVTLCRPGTSICQTIDHVLLDTGSFGLRILVPGILNSSLALPAITGPGGKAAGECAQFFSGFLWGSVHRADVKIAGETASSLPVQLVADTDSLFSTIPADCRNTGANQGTITALGANGMLGVGLFKQDCGPACVTSAVSGFYYECTSSGCANTTMPLASQVANPVAAFSTNNNGVVLSMPAVSAGGATSLTGALIFGIDTQSNNRVGDAKVYAANSSGNFTTTYNGATLRSSFLDSGSNGLFFADATIPQCSGSSRYPGFYCPASTLLISAVNASASGSPSGTVNVSIVNPLLLDPTVRAASIGGRFTRGGIASRTFDWGMPFFFGRTVFVAFDGATTQHGTGPYWAY